MKLCECGCENPAPVAKTNIKRLKHTKGEPIRFINGHYLKSKNYPFLKKQERWVLRTRKGFVPWSHVVYEYNFLGGKQIPKGFHIHHKNLIVNDDRPENLELLRKGDHRRIHQNKPVILVHPSGKSYFFESAREASKYLNLDKHAVSKAIYAKCRIKKYIPYYQKNGMPLDIGSISKKTTKLEKDGKVKIFESAADASRYFGLSRSAVSVAIYNNTYVQGWTPSYLEDCK